MGALIVAAFTPPSRKEAKPNPAKPLDTVVFTSEGCVVQAELVVQLPAEPLKL